MTYSLGKHHTVLSRKQCILFYLPAMCTVINQNMMKTSTIYNLKEEQHICIIIYIYDETLFLSNHVKPLPAVFLDFRAFYVHVRRHNQVVIPTIHLLLL